MNMVSKIAREVLPKVAGFCPMGCGETLVLGSSGRIMCTDVGCKNLFAMTMILGNEDHVHHIVWIAEKGFEAQHPLRERLDARLYDCSLHRFLMSLPGPPKPSGVYRVFDPDLQGNWHYADWEWIRHVTEEEVERGPGQGRTATVGGHTQAEVAAEEVPGG